MKCETSVVLFLLFSCICSCVLWLLLSTWHCPCFCVSVFVCLSFCLSVFLCSVFCVRVLCSCSVFVFCVLCVMVCQAASEVGDHGEMGPRRVCRRHTSHVLRSSHFEQKEISRPCISLVSVFGMQFPNKASSVG